LYKYRKVIQFKFRVACIAYVASSNIITLVMHCVAPQPKIIARLQSLASYPFAWCLYNTTWRKTRYCCSHWQQKSVEGTKGVPEQWSRNSACHS